MSDLISREVLKDIKYINKGNFNTVEGIREWIDKAPTIDYPFYAEAYQTGYEEGYSQGYIDGSTGADWKGGTE